MASMNERISKHFSTMVDLRLTQLDTLVEGVPSTFHEDNDKLREWLQYNSELRGFESLAYYYEDGSFDMIYGTEVSPTDAQMFLESMRNGERKVSVGIEPNGEKAAVIGVLFEAQTMSGKRSISIVGKMPIEYINETLSLNDVKSLLYSFAIRKDGIFVIGNADTLRDNYFDRAKDLYTEVSGVGSVDQFITELKAAMEKNKDYSAMIKIGDERRQMYCSKFPVSEWYLVTILPYGTLNETVEAQGHQSIIVFISSCTMILVSLVAIFIRYFNLSH